MKKYFVMSDIHSFFSQMQSALSDAGFDVYNPDHILLICGDIFDRGSETVQLYNWLTDLPADRLILVQGNHELLYFDLLTKDLPDNHDYSNGTVRTFCDLANMDYRDLDPHELYFKFRLEGKNPTSNEVQLKLKDNWRKVLAAVKKHPATAWLKSDEWHNYHELGNLIFVHSFVPTRLKESVLESSFKYYFPYDLPSDMLELVPDWRTSARDYEWDDAKWGCPWKQFTAGLFNDEMANGKTLVCGHWHASDFHRKFEADMSNNMNIFYSDSLIALDACTAASGFCNVLVLDFEAGLVYDQNHKVFGGLR